MKAKIYKPARTAMQSGRGKINKWVLEYEQDTARVPEPLMGWVSSGDTLNQVRLSFKTAEDAAAFADKHGLEYNILPSHERRGRPRNYGDNFRYHKKGKR